MKNKICKAFIISFAFICLFLCGNVKAASATVSVKSSSSMVVVGRTFNVTVTVSSDVAIANWEYTLAYDSNKLELTSGKPYIMDMVTSTDVKSRSYNYTFRAKASGSANIYIQSAAVLSWDGSIPVSRGSRSVTLRTQAEIEASYSKNNYLSSLGVDGVELSPAFSKDTLEYTVEMEPGTTKVNLTGAVEDRTASLEGLGEKEVSEGANRFEIKVTAQNGNVRTYVVVVNVKEYNPIEVTTTDDKKLRVIRKKSDLPQAIHCQETTIKIGEEEVPAYSSDITKYTLVGLKDEEGNTGLYVYDSTDNSYRKYEVHSFHKTYISFLEVKEVPKYYHKTTIVLDDMEVPAYKITESSDYALLYGINIETGNEHYYIYNSEEHTLQIYYTEELEILEKENEKYLYIGIALAAISVILLISLIIVICKGKKAKNKNSYHAEHGKKDKKE